MKKILNNQVRSLYLHLVATVLGLGLLLITTNAQAARDTTTFRIKVLQDSVYAGDTIDVEFYIGNGSGSLLQLNLLKQMEIEIAANPSLTNAELTSFRFDNSSLVSFFNTALSNITTSSVLYPALGRLNIKVSSNKTGKGNALVGRGKYIVQDNVAGRQLMPFIFTKATSSGLLLIQNPVKVITDSVWIIGRTDNEGVDNHNNGSSTPAGPPNQTPTQTPETPTRTKDGEGFGDRKKTETIQVQPPKVDYVMVYPNPTYDVLNVEAGYVEQYKLISIDGSVVLSGQSDVNENTPLHLNVRGLNAGMYLLMVRTNAEWKSFKIVKK